MFASVRLLRVTLLVLAFSASLFGTTASAQVADLVVSKTGPEEVAAGTNITYTVTLTNAGAVSASSVTLSDASPANTTFVSATQLSGPAFSCTRPTPGNTGTVTCTAATFAAGQTAQFEIVFAVNASTPPGTTISNTAIAGSALPDPTPANNSSTANASVAATADVAVTKSGPAQAAAGTNVTYDVTVRNLGPHAAANVALIDEVPAGMTFIGTNATGAPHFTCTTPDSGDTGTITCTAATLPAGASAAFQFVFTIPAGTEPSTTFTNVATVTTTSIDPNDENDTGVASTTTPAPPVGDVGVSKGGPIAAGRDTDVVFIIRVFNSGPAAATNLSLQDTLPGDLVFQTLEQSGTPLACTTPPMGAGGTITCTAASFAAGASTTLTLTARVPSSTPSGTTYTNTVTVVSDNDPNEENNIANFTVTVSSVDLEVTKTAPATATAGDVIDYVITVRNTGVDPATTVQLTDVLPAGTTFVSFTAAPLSFCNAPPAGTNGTVTCTREVLAANASTQFTIRVRLGNVTSVTNVATVTSESFDTDPADNSDDAATTVTPSADLRASKSGAASAVPGTNVTYTLGITNTGPSTSTSVSLVDELPANTTFVSLTQTAGPAFNCTTGATITCTAATLAPAASATFSLVVQVATGATGSVANTVTVSDAVGDPNTTNDTATVTTTLTPSADLAVTKSGPAAAGAGTNATYTIGISNLGPSNAATVTLSDALPPNTTFVSLAQTAGPTFNCTTPAPGANGTVTCSIATLTATTSASFDLVVRIAPEATGSITNTATRTTATADPNTANDSASTTTTLGAVADLAVTKSGPAAAGAGTNATYTIGISNLGPSNAATVTLGDALPPNTTFVSLAQTAGPTFNCTTPAPGANGTVTCSIATLTATTSASFDLVVRIAPEATGSITNTATRTTATADPNTANDSASTTTTLGAVADLAVTKNGPANAVAGDNLTYTITVSNAGPAAAANVVITDALPTGTTFVSLTQTAGPTFNCTTPAAGANGTVTCSIPALAVTSASFTLVANVSSTSSGTLANSVAVSSTTADPTPANSAATAPTTVAPQTTDIAITKTPSTTNAIITETITYTLVVTNLGPNNSTGTTVTDVLPPGTTFVSATSTQGTCSGTTTVTCAIGTLAPNATATITLAVTLPQAPGPVVNTATVTSAQIDPAAANNAATATINVGADAPSNIPTLSPIALALLGLAMAIAVLWRTSAS
jgi:uncharacterized repeat protein (TIGR01451 family)